MSVDVDKYRKTMEARLAELDARLNQIDDTLDGDASKDSEDRTSERGTDEVLEDLGETSVEEVLMIRAAMDRVEAGTFGTCAECGEEISAARLDVVPHAPLCRDCARAAE